MADDPNIRHLMTARDCVDRLARDHRAVTAGMASYVTGAGNGIDPQGHVQWTTVEAAMLKRAASQAGRYQNLIEVATRALLEADTIRGLVVTSTVNVTKASAEARCDGYDRPECEDNGVQTVWVNGANLFLCSKCWGRYRVAKHRESV